MTQCWVNTNLQECLTSSLIRICTKVHKTPLTLPLKWVWPLVTCIYIYKYFFKGILWRNIYLYINIIYTDISSTQVRSLHTDKVSLEYKCKATNKIVGSFISIHYLLVADSTVLCARQEMLKFTDFLGLNQHVHFLVLPVERLVGG